MTQTKIYSLRQYLDPIKSESSDVIHSWVIDALKYNWGFRGLPGDEHQLNYKVEV